MNDLPVQPISLQSLASVSRGKAVDLMRARLDKKNQRTEAADTRERQHVRRTVGGKSNEYREVVEEAAEQLISNPAAAPQRPSDPLPSHSALPAANEAGSSGCNQLQNAQQEAEQHLALAEEALLEADIAATESEQRLVGAFSALGVEGQAGALIAQVRSSAAEFVTDKRPVVRQLATAVQQLDTAHAAVLTAEQLQHKELSTHQLRNLFDQRVSQMDKTHARGVANLEGQLETAHNEIHFLKKLLAAVMITKSGGSEGISDGDPAMQKSRELLDENQAWALEMLIDQHTLGVRLR